MAPKAKAKVKAKAKAKGKAKAAPRPRGGLRGGRRRVGDLRRPAISRGVDHEEKWKKGEEIDAWNLDPRWLTADCRVVCRQAFYYGGEGKVAGEITAVEVLGAEVTIKMKLIGTTEDRLLTWATGNAPAVVRVHLCQRGCGKEPVADDLLHATCIRRGGSREQEDGWVTNLMPIPGGPPDELPQLRARAEALAEVVPPEKEAKKKKEDASSSESGRKKKKKKKKKGKKEKDSKKEKDKRGKEEDESIEGKKKKKDGSEDEVYDGSRARACCKKTASALFRGTGLDPKASVWHRVFRRARKHLKNKEKESSSESGSSSSSSGMEQPDPGGAGIFLSTSKVRRVAELFPGALAAQTLEAMKEQLLTEVGVEQKSEALVGIGVPYFRQFLSRKATGPQLRELLTLLSSVDAILSGKPAAAADMLLQRVNHANQPSAEHTGQWPRGWKFWARSRPRLPLSQS